MIDRYALQYVLDVTHPSGGTSRFWRLSRERCYELAGHYRALGDACAAHDDDYGYALELNPDTRE